MSACFVACLLKKHPKLCAFRNRAWINIYCPKCVKTFVLKSTWSSTSGISTSKTKFVQFVLRSFVTKTITNVTDILKKGHYLVKFVFKLFIVSGICRCIWRCMHNLPYHCYFCVKIFPLGYMIFLFWDEYKSILCLSDDVSMSIMPL